MWTPGYPTYCTASLVLIDVKMIHKTEHAITKMLRMYNSNNYGNPAIAYMYLRVYWSVVDPDPNGSA
jgi:hypothetical protein